MCRTTAETRIGQEVTKAGLQDKAPIGVVLQPPSLLARYACASAMAGTFWVWGKLSFVDEASAPTIGTPLHSFMVPLVLTSLYLVSLPLLRIFATKYLSENVDVKVLLKETMVVYNAGQVLLNTWMVYRYFDALLFRGHPFIGDTKTLTSGATYACWIHYMDKYLEFFDTVFMVLRGRMDQVSFLHVYHHVSIAWAWWVALSCWPGGDVYFGALLNSLIHVMMYSYYTLSLLKITCPWKRYLTQAQLLQFTTVVVYSVTMLFIHYKKNEIGLFQYLGIFVQCFEMISLFVLFMHFYRKAYKLKKNAEEKRNDSGSDSITEQVSIGSASTDEGAKKEQ